MSSPLSTAWTVLASALDPVPEPEDVNPGWIALIVVVALVTVTVLLWFSLRRQLRKVDVDRDTERRPGEHRDAGEHRGDDQESGPA